MIRLSGLALGWKYLIIDYGGIVGIWPYRISSIVRDKRETFDSMVDFKSVTGFK